MKKIALVLAAIIVLGGVGYIVSTQLKDNATNTADSQTAAKQIDACGLFTLGDAKKLLGVSTTGGADKVTGVSTSETAAVSTCAYTNNSKVPTSIQNIVILVRSSSESNGDSAKTGFDQAKTASSQDVSGYGDGAYWNPELGQLNILKGSAWVIITAGPGKISSRSVDLAKKVAGVAVPKI